MNWQLILAIASTVLTLLSLAVAFRENRAKERAKSAEKRMRDIHQKLCRSKCISLLGTARELTNNSVRACELVITGCAKKSAERKCLCDHSSELTGNMFAIRTATNTLIDSCKVIHDEYKSEFGEPVAENYEESLQHALCKAAQSL